MYAFKIHVFQRPPSSDVCDRADIDCLFEEQNDDDHDLELWSFSTIDALCGGVKKQKNSFLRSWNSISEIQNIKNLDLWNECVVEGWSSHVQVLTLLQPPVAFVKLLKLGTSQAAKAAQTLLRLEQVE